MNPPHTVYTHNNPTPMRDPSSETGASPNNPSPPLAERHEDCECSYPWWLLLIGAAAGGVGGYALGRYSASEPDEEDL